MLPMRMPNGATSGKTIITREMPRFVSLPEKGLDGV